MADSPNRLFIVTARLEFQYPVLAESREAAEAQWVAKEAMRDLGRLRRARHLDEVPWDISADAAGPAYQKPDGYDGACLVYFGSPPRVDVTWDDAVKSDKAYAARLDVVERLDYSKPPAGFLPHPNDSTIPRFAHSYITVDGATVQETLQLRSDEEAIAALWGKVKLGQDPPGMHLIAMGVGWGTVSAKVSGLAEARRRVAWDIYDYRLALSNKGAPWPLALTWSPDERDAWEDAR